MDFNVVKALHIIFVVSWFAGLFYMVRLFIYHIEAQEKPQNEARILGDQFKIMEKKLWYVITTPAMVLTVLFGTWMIIQVPGFLKMPWMHVKLLFVVFLLIYHFICQKIMNDLKKDTFKWSSTQLRLWNELATLFLVIIVFIVELQNTLSWVKATVGFFAVGVALMLAVKIYKRLRKK
jgi:putative membrane protein